MWHFLLSLFWFVFFLCFVSPAFLWITWTYFRVAFLLIYSIFEYTSLYSFSVVVLGVTLYILNITTYILPVQVNYRNLTSFYVSFTLCINVLNISSTCTIFDKQYRTLGKKKKNLLHLILLCSVIHTSFLVFQNFFFYNFLPS